MLEWMRHLCIWSNVWSLLGMSMRRIGVMKMSVGRMAFYRARQGANFPRSANDSQCELRV